MLNGIVVQVFCPGAGFAVAYVGSAFRANDGRGRFAADLAIDAAAARVVACRVVGQHGDLIAEEACGARARLGEQGLGLGELQLERLA